MNDIYIYLYNNNTNNNVNGEQLLLYFLKIIVDDGV